MRRGAWRKFALLAAAAMATVVPGSATATNVTGLQITVPNTPVAISGTIRTAAGAPVDMALIDMYGTTVHTDANGRYAIHGLPHGSYRLLVDPRRVTPTAQSGWFAAGKPYNFTADINQATVLHYTGTSLHANVRLPLGHTISGRITRAVGDGAVSGMLVRASTGSSGDPFFDRQTVTDSGGRYVIPGLVDANYRLSFSPTAASHQNVLAGCYAANLPHGFAQQCNQATLVVVNGNNVANRNIGVPDGHRVWGRVRDPHGAPLCYRMEASSTGEPPTARLPATIGCGAFTVVGVPAGTLTLTFFARGNSHFLQIQKHISVADSDVGGVTIWPNPGNTISGRVVTSHGDPVPNAMVMLSNASVGGPYTKTDADGQYSLTVEHRPWRVYVDPTNAGVGYNSGANGRAGWYKSATANHWTADVDQATTLAAGSHSDINLRLPPGYTISGRLLDGSGAPVAASIDVGTYDPGGTYSSYATTDAEGKWTATGLEPGHYEIRIAPDDITATGYPEGFYSSTSAGRFTRIQSRETLVYIGP